MDDDDIDYGNDGRFAAIVVIAAIVMIIAMIGGGIWGFLAAG